MVSWKATGSGRNFQSAALRGSNVFGGKFWGSLRQNTGGSPSLGTLHLPRAPLLSGSSQPCGGVEPARSLWGLLCKLAKGLGHQTSSQQQPCVSCNFLLGLSERERSRLHFSAPFLPGGVAALPPGHNSPLCLRASPSREKCNPSAAHLLWKERQRMP